MPIKDEGASGDGELSGVTTVGVCMNASGEGGRSETKSPSSSNSCVKWNVANPSNDVIFTVNSLLSNGTKGGGRGTAVSTLENYKKDDIACNY